MAKGWHLVTGTREVVSGTDIEAYFYLDGIEIGSKYVAGADTTMVQGAGDVTWGGSLKYATDSDPCLM